MFHQLRLIFAFFSSFFLFFFSRRPAPCHHKLRRARITDLKSRSLHTASFHLCYPTHMVSWDIRDGGNDEALPCTPSPPPDMHTVENGLALTDRLVQQKANPPSIIESRLTIHRAASFRNGGAGAPPAIRAILAGLENSGHTCDGKVGSLLLRQSLAIVRRCVTSKIACKLEMEIWGQRLPQPSEHPHYESLAQESDEVGMHGNKQWKWIRDQLEIVTIFMLPEIPPKVIPPLPMHVLGDHPRCQNSLSCSFPKLTPCAT